MPLKRIIAQGQSSHVGCLCDAFVSSKLELRCTSNLSKRARVAMKPALGGEWVLSAAEAEAQPSSAQPGR